MRITNVIMICPMYKKAGKKIQWKIANWRAIDRRDIEFLNCPIVREMRLSRLSPTYRD